MEYISHEDYKKMLTGFGKEVPKAKLNEGLEKEGNAFTAGLAKTKKGGEFKVGDKAVKDTSNYDSSMEEEMHSFDNIKMDTPHAHKLKVKTPNFSGTIFKNEDGTYVFYDVDNHNADPSLPPFKTITDLMKHFGINMQDLHEDEAAARGEDDDEGVEEGAAEILGHIKGDIYKVKTPKGEVIDLEFELERGDRTDDYGYEGNLVSYDDDYEYILPVALVPMGGGDYDINPYYVEFTAIPVRNTPIKETDSMVDTKLTKIAGLYKDKAIKHEEIEKIVNALTGQGHEINVRYVQEFLKNHDVQLDEYQFDQMYPDDPGPFEGIEKKLKEFLAKEDDVNWDRMDDEEAEENETDNGIEEDEMEEDINLPSSQPTGPSIEEKRSRLAHLTSEERDQLKQYVETIKTVKEEIKKMVGKKDMEEGGDNTNLIMQPTTVSEEGGGEHDEIESSLDPKIHDAFHKVAGMAVKSLIKAGIEPDQIKAFFQHEISELPDFVTNQYEE